MVSSRNSTIFRLWDDESDRENLAELFDDPNFLKCKRSVKSNLERNMSLNHSTNTSIGFPKLASVAKPVKSNAKIKKSKKIQLVDKINNASKAVSRVGGLRRVQTHKYISNYPSSGFGDVADLPASKASETILTTSNNISTNPSSCQAESTLNYGKYLNLRVSCDKSISVKNPEQKNCKNNYAAEIDTKTKRKQQNPYVKIIHEDEGFGSLRPRVEYRNMSTKQLGQGLKNCLMDSE